MTSVPSYITQSKHGVFYFQKRVCDKTQAKLGITQSLYRKSLKTKSKREAVIRASEIQVDLLNLDKMYYETFQDELDDLLSQGLFEQRLDRIYEARQKFYPVAEQYLSTPEPKKIDLPKGATCKRDMLIEGYSTYEISAIFYFIDEVLSDYEVESEEAFLEKINQTNSATVHIPPQTSPENDNSTSQKSSNHQQITKLFEEADNNRCLRELLDEYLAYKRRNGKANASTDKYESQLNLFIETLDSSITSLQLNKSHLRLFMNIIDVYPKNKHQGKYRDLTVEEILESMIDEQHKMSIPTKNGYISSVKSFLDWAIKHDYVQTGITVVLERISAPKTQKSSGYESFDSEQLKAIFAHDLFQQKQYKPSFEWKYWVPLIALYSGARLNEVCQLKFDDIKEKDGIHFFSIDDQDDKGVKSVNSLRDVPIHSELIRLGFLDYVAKRRNIRCSSEQLFYGLTYTTKCGYSKKVGTWFPKYLEKINVKAEGDKRKLVFHSFRETFINHLYQETNTPPDKVADVVGHEKKSFTNKTYAKELSLEKKKEIVDSVHFDLGL